MSIFSVGQSLQLKLLSMPAGVDMIPGITYRIVHIANPQPIAIDASGETLELASGPYNDVVSRISANNAILHCNVMPSGVSITQGRLWESCAQKHLTALTQLRQAGDPLLSVGDLLRVGSLGALIPGLLLPDAVYVVRMVCQGGYLVGRFDTRQAEQMFPVTIEEITARCELRTAANRHQRFEIWIPLQPTEPTTATATASTNNARANTSNLTQPRNNATPTDNTTNIETTLSIKLWQNYRLTPNIDREDLRVPVIPSGSLQLVENNGSTVRLRRHSGVNRGIYQVSHDDMYEFFEVKLHGQWIKLARQDNQPTTPAPKPKVNNQQVSSVSRRPRRFQ